MFANTCQDFLCFVGPSHELDGWWRGRRESDSQVFCHHLVSATDRILWLFSGCR